MSPAPRVQYRCCSFGFASASWCCGVPRSGAPPPHPLPPLEPERAAAPATCLKGDQQLLSPCSWIVPAVLSFQMVGHILCERRQQYSREQHRGRKPARSDEELRSFYSQAARLLRDDAESACLHLSPTVPSRVPELQINALKRVRIQVSGTILAARSAANPAMIACFSARGLKRIAATTPPTSKPNSLNLKPQTQTP